MKKRLLACLLTVMMLFSMLPVSALAAGSVTAVTTPDALKNALEAGNSSIRLDADITLSSKVQIPGSKNVKLMLNGHKLTTNAQIKLQNNASLTITGNLESSEIVSTNNAARMFGLDDGASLTLTNGTYTASRNFIVVDNGEATVTINSNSDSETGEGAVISWGTGYNFVKFDTNGQGLTVTDNGGSYVRADIRSYKSTTVTLNIGDYTVYDGIAYSYYDSWDEAYAAYEAANSGSVVSTVTINNPTKTITVKIDSAGDGTTYDKIVTVSGSKIYLGEGDEKDGFEFQGWSTSGTDVNVVIDDDGFTTVGSSGGVTYTAVYEAIAYTVTNTLTNVTTSNSAETVTYGDSYSATLTANSGYALSSVEVTMGDEDITSTAHLNGSISISSVSGNIVITATATVPASGVTLDTTTLTLTEGETATLTATVSPSDATNQSVTWSSDDENVATVVDGVVTAVSAGTATITVATSDGSYTDSCVVTVTAATTEVEVKVTVGIDEVPAGLKYLYNNPEEIVEDLRTEVSRRVSNAAGMAVYDVNVLVSTDGGKTWAVVTEDYFREYGYLTFEIDYPEDSDSSFDFTVLHMFTEAIGNYDAGQIETCDVVKKADKLQITIHGLSPIIVAWEKPSTPSRPTYDYSEDISYRITTPTTTNGAITLSDTRAYEGDKVTITVEPDDGYELESLTVTTSSGKEVKLTQKSDTKYTFTMPSSKVTITATFTKIAEEEEVLGTLITVVPTTPFTDISNSRYKDAIAYVYDAGLMNGTTATTFEPDSTLTRGMIVTVLYRLAGEPEVSGSSIFADVADGQWYTNAIIWATENGIVNGYGNGNFGPNDEVTREQMMAIFYRYASANSYYMGNTFALDGFTDNADVSAYAVTALEWGFANTMIQSRTTAMINPKDAATRAEVAQALYILIK